jgi:cation transport ATPase
MRKTFELENLECANCAAKMERDISAFPEVKKCTITFMTSRMSITIVDGANLDDVLDRAQQVMRSYEKDCTIVR